VDKAPYLGKQATQKSYINTSDRPGLGGDETTEKSTPQYGKTPLVYMCRTAVTLQSGEFELDKASKVVTAEPDIEAPECNEKAA